MEHRLILEWNVNYLLYMLFLILLTGFTMFIIAVIRVLFSLQIQVYGDNSNKKKRITRAILSYASAFFVGCLNSIGIFFYMFKNININFIIISFIPVITIICICWSIRLSCVAALPSLLVYILVGSLYLKISFFDILTPIFAFSIMFTGAFFCKVYKLNKYWQVFVMQLIFTLLCTIVMSTTLNSADNIYVNFNNQITPLKDIEAIANFKFYFINIVLSNIASNIINLSAFMLFYYTTKKTEGIINNLLVINNLSYYLDGVFVNSKIAKIQMKEEIKNAEFYLNISIYLPNISSTIEGIKYKDEKQIKSKIIKHLEHKFKNYKPIYYKNKWGFYSLLISLKDFDITSNLNDLYNHKNEKFNEIYDFLESYVTTICYDNKSYPYSIKNFMCLYGIHTYDFNELDDISYRLYKENKNSKQNVFLYNPAERISHDDRIDFSNYQDEQIDKTKFNITFLKNKKHKTIVEPNISYLPLLLISKYHLFEYLDLIDDSKKIKRYLALEVLKQFKKQEETEESYKGASVVLDYPETPLIEQKVDVKYLIKKINQNGLENKRIIFKFSDENIYEESDFIEIIRELKDNHFKIWLSEISIKTFREIINYINIDYVSFKKDIKLDEAKTLVESRKLTLLESEVCA